MEHLQKMKPEDLARLHPRVGERMARDSDAIRSRLEEARRLNMDELRELQRCVCHLSGIAKSMSDFSNTNRPVLTRHMYIPIPVH